MKRTILATLLVVTIMLLTGRVFANVTEAPDGAPVAANEERKALQQEQKEARKELRTEQKEARTTLKLEQKESREALKAQFKQARKEAATNPELQEGMISAAKNYLTAFGDNLVEHIDRIIAKLSTIAVLDTDTQTAFADDLGVLKLQVASVQESVNAVTTFDELKAVRTDMRETFAEFRAILKDLRAAIKTAKEAANTPE